MSCGTTKTYLHDVVHELDSGHVPTTISILGEGWGDSGAKKLAAALVRNARRPSAAPSELGQLQSVYLMNNQIGDDGLQALLDALRLFPGVQSLNLNGNWVTRAGAEHLAEFIRHSVSLRNLYLLNTRIGPDGRDFLFSVLQFRREIQAFY